MATSSAKLFPDKEKKMADLFKALSHPARIAILKYIAEQQECICGDLVSHLPLAQATVSQHLRVLKEADLIKGEISGPRSCYCVNNETLNELGGLFTDLQNECAEACASC